MDDKTYKFATFITGILVTIIGTITNGLSLSYFIRSSRFNKTGIANKLLILLNLFDLLLCIDYFFITLHIMVQGPPTLYSIIVVLGVTLSAATGFLTTVISVSRTILLFNPFYSINKPLLVTAMVTVLIYFLAKNASLMFLMATPNDGWLLIEYILSVELMIMILIATTCCILSTWKLRQSSESSSEKSMVANRSHAAVTMIILSVVFSFLNLYLSLSIIVRRSTSFSTATSVFHWVNLFENISIPLNSALNPAIYISRKKALRRYVGSLFDTMMPENHGVTVV